MISVSLFLVASALVGMTDVLPDLVSQAWHSIAPLLGSAIGAQWRAMKHEKDFKEHIAQATPPAHAPNKADA